MRQGVQGEGFLREVRHPGQPEDEVVKDQGGAKISPLIVQGRKNCQDERLGLCRGGICEVFVFWKLAKQDEWSGAKFLSCPFNLWRIIAFSPEKFKKELTKNSQIYFVYAVAFKKCFILHENCENCMVRYGVLKRSGCCIF